MSMQIRACGYMITSKTLQIAQFIFDSVTKFIFDSVNLPVLPRCNAITSTSPDDCGCSPHSFPFPQRNSQKSISKVYAFDERFVLPFARY